MPRTDLRVFGVWGSGLGTMVADVRRKNGMDEGVRFGLATGVVLCRSTGEGLFSDPGDSLPTRRLKLEEKDHFLTMPFGRSGGDSSGVVDSSCNGT